MMTSKTYVLKYHSATLISILRAKPTWHYRDTLDQTWDTIDLLAWSEAEIAVACICVSDLHVVQSVPQHSANRIDLY